MCIFMFLLVTIHLLYWPGPLTFDSCFVQTSIQAIVIVDTTVEFQASRVILRNGAAPDSGPW